MNTLLVCIATVAMGELGDKTQLLALLLAVRYRRPATIIAGIVVATVVNHLLAASVGVWFRDHLTSAQLQWGVGLSFFAVAAWTLKPDTLAADDGATAVGRFGLFGLTVVSFFIAEIGDKTQIATALLAARYGDPLLVVSGTTVGMLLVDAPSVMLGHRMGNRVPMGWVRAGAALLFAGLGAMALLQALQSH